MDTDHRLAMIRAQARKEFTEERFRAAVEEEKVRLRTHRSLWDRIFPFTITVRRKQK
jgi:hypothetical protein